jgi:hypothetical protein
VHELDDRDAALGVDRVGPEALMFPRRGEDSGATTVPPPISIAAPPAASRPQ